MTILIADDDRSVLVALEMLFKSANIETVSANSPKQALELIERRKLELALIDLNYCQDTTSGKEGLELISSIKKLDPEIPIIVMTGWGTVQLAVETMQIGANDFIEKPWDNNRLLAIVNNQIKLSQAQKREEVLKAENDLLKSHNDDQNFIANSPAMRELYEVIERIAPTELNILITGENGTGKSLLARQIHKMSQRKDKSFISVNMGAVSETTFESEMFGHIKGAFTDAKNNRIGRVELANEGTLFLDEIANTPMTQQAKLLHVLEEREYEPLGSSRSQKADIRLISATNADIEELIADKQFRQDLLYRINSFKIEIPALRDRKEDIPELAEQFLQQAAKQFNREGYNFSNEAIQALQMYHWPGNVRELHHVVERAIILAKTKTIVGADLLLPGSKSNTNTSTHDTNVTAQPYNAELENMTLEQVEKHFIEQALSKNNGSAQEAAKALGLSRSAFYRRLEKFGITAN